MRRLLPLSFVVVFCALTACRREASPVDASLTHRDVPPEVARTHVCYGANNSAVELPIEVRCETVGGSERIPDYAPPPPRLITRRDASR